MKTFNGHSYVGFKSLGFLNNNGSKSGKNIPASWCQHTFTDDEKDSDSDSNTAKIFGVTAIVVVFLIVFLVIVVIIIVAVIIIIFVIKKKD